MPRALLVLLLVVSAQAEAKFAFYSWNMKHLGRDRQNLDRVAEILGGGTFKLHDKNETVLKIPPGDLIVLQEVNTSFPGLKNLRKLRNAIAARRVANGGKEEEDFRMCSAVSENPSDGGERYAMIWNEKKLHRVNSNAEDILCEKSGDSPEKLPVTEHLKGKIVREPAYAWFRDYSSKGQKKFRAFTQHAVPTAKHPEDEIPLVFQAVEYHSKQDGPPNERVIVAGDFNLSAGDNAFEKAREVYSVVFGGNPPTSLKSSKKELNEPYDNILVKNISFDPKKDLHHVINLYHVFDLAPSTTYQTLSDHCPLVAEFDLDK